MSPGPEFENVAQPFLDQFVSMRWKHTTRSWDHATPTDFDNVKGLLTILQAAFCCPLRLPWDLSMK